MLAATPGIVPGAAPAVLALDAPLTTPGTPRWTVLAGTTPLPRGAPIYLRTRTLRL